MDSVGGDWRRRHLNAVEHRVGLRQYGSMTWDALGRLAASDDRTFTWSGSDELRRVVYDDGTTSTTETRTYDVTDQRRGASFADLVARESA